MRVQAPALTVEGTTFGEERLFVSAQAPSANALASNNSPIFLLSMHSSFS
jgi:hypothetical protein